MAAARAETKNAEQQAQKRIGWGRLGFRRKGTSGTTAPAKLKDAELKMMQYNAENFFSIQLHSENTARIQRSDSEDSSISDGNQQQLDYPTRGDFIFHY